VKLFFERYQLRFSIKMRLFFLILSQLVTVSGYLSGQTINATDALGRRQGLWVYRDPNMSIEAIEEHYKDGVLEGPVKRYDVYRKRRPKLMLETNYKAGKIDGVFKEYWEKTGRLKTLAYYENGKKQGYLYWYYSNGNVEAKMFFNNDTLNGVIESYNKQGKIEIKNFVRNGVRSDTFQVTDEKGVPVFFYVFSKTERLLHLILDDNKNPTEVCYIMKCIPKEYKDGTRYFINKQSLFGKSSKKVGWQFIHKDDVPLGISISKKRKIKVYFDDQGRILDKNCPCQKLPSAIP
jgi:antitoxin component YwqK of YwqJK toxin-antitoxin module